MNTERLVDDVLAREQIGDLAQAQSARNIDDLFAIERPGGFELVLAVRIDKPAGDRDHENDGENRIAGDDQRVACPA